MSSPRIKRWKLLPSTPGRADSIARRFSIHPAVAGVLAARGWDDAADGLDHYLSPLLKNIRNPFELRDMQAAVDRTHCALRAGEKICVYGDYDVDGISSTALLVGTLRYLGARPMIVIPHRLNDGYGMNNNRVQEIAEAGCKLIITVDTGVSAVEPIRLARKHGIDVVVTDHHLAGGELPEAVAIVNPNRPDVLYEHGRLCGAGVAFKFAHALLKKSSLPEAEAKAFLMQQLDLVALGTIADVVPLLGENRVLAHHGLNTLLNTRRAGIRALFDVGRLNTDSISAETVAFGLGPRLNAAGRTDDAMRALELLLTNDARVAKQLAEHLEFLNRERRKIEMDIYEESLVEIESGEYGDFHAVVVGGEGWHIGVVGIVASRLTERFDAPSIVLGIEDGLAKGSARSVPGYDIHEALNACEEFLVTFGGHASAAGLKLRAEHVVPFRKALNTHAAEAFAGQPREHVIDVDSEITADMLTWDLYNDLKRMEPFGEGNPCPLFMMRGLEAAGVPRIVGRDHLRTRLRSRSRSFDAIGFSLGHLKEYVDAGPVDVLFRPRENNYNGMVSLEMELVDVRRAGNGE